jgi:hypothetical protein
MVGGFSYKRAVLRKKSPWHYARGFFAERMGFEPTITFWAIHTFQACSFDHSDTSLNGAAKIG